MPDQSLFYLSLDSCFQSVCVAKKCRCSTGICLHQRTVFCKWSCLLTVLSGPGFFCFLPRIFLGYRASTCATLDVCELPWGGYLLRQCFGESFLLNSVEVKESAERKALTQILVLKGCEIIVHADNKIHMDMAFWKPVGMLRWFNFHSVILSEIHMEVIQK